MSLNLLQLFVLIFSWHLITSSTNNINNMFGLEGRGEKWPLFGLEGKRGKNKNMKWNDFHGSHQFLKILLSFQIHKIASIL